MDDPRSSRAAARRIVDEVLAARGQTRTPDGDDGPPTPPQDAETAASVDVGEVTPDEPATVTVATETGGEGDGRRRARELVAEVLAARAAPRSATDDRRASPVDAVPASHLAPATARDAPSDRDEEPGAAAEEPVVAEEVVDPSRARARELVAAALADAAARAAAAEADRRAAADRARERAEREAERRRRVAAEHRAASRRGPGPVPGESDAVVEEPSDEAAGGTTRPLTIAELAAAGVQGGAETTVELGDADPELTVPLARRDDVPPPADPAPAPVPEPASVPETAGSPPIAADGAVDAPTATNEDGPAWIASLRPEDEVPDPARRTPTPRDVAVEVAPALEASVPVPEETARPRRTGRWLLTSILGAVALAVLFPMAVDALRALVQL